MLAEGDQSRYAQPGYTENQWKKIFMDTWIRKLNKDLNDTVWYKNNINIPLSLKSHGYDNRYIKISFGKIRGAVQFYLNGHLVYENSTPVNIRNFKKEFPVEKPFPVLREYFIPANDSRIKWGEDNEITIRILDKSGNGGLLTNVHYISMKGLEDCIDVNTNIYKFTGGDSTSKHLILENKTPDLTIGGRLILHCQGVNTETELLKKDTSFYLLPGKRNYIYVPLPFTTDPVAIEVKLTDDRLNAEAYIRDTLNYVLNHDIY